MSLQTQEHAGRAAYLAQLPDDQAGSLPVECGRSWAEVVRGVSGIAIMMYRSGCGSASGMGDALVSRRG